MPSEQTEFRVGDRVEVRRAERIPEEFRQRRAEVESVTDHGVYLRLANPVIDTAGDEDHGGLWDTRDLRLVERTLRLEVGARVVVSNPAYSSLSGGAVDTTFYGATCRVVGLHCPNVWRVQDPETDYTNVIHADYLTVIEEVAPPRFTTGDLVQVADEAYRSPTPTPHETPVCNVGVATIHSQRGWDPDRWYITDDTGNLYDVNEAYLTPYVDDTEPTLSLGDRVRVLRGARTYLEGREVDNGYFGMEGVIIQANGARYTLRLLGSTSEVRVHQNWLEQVEQPVPERDDYVRISGSALRQYANSLEIATTALYGRVLSVSGNDVILTVEGGGAATVHPAFMEVISAEEYGAAWKIGDRFRTTLDCDLPGRIGTLASRRRLGGWNVTLDRYGGFITTEARMVKINPVTFAPEGHARCAECHEAVPLGEVVEWNGSRWCSSCMIDCAECSVAFRVSDGALNRYEDQWMCGSCLRGCTSCYNIYSISLLSQHQGGYYCENCLSTCQAEDCEEVTFGGYNYCQDCRDDIGYDALGSWRRTQAVYWLGGPVRESGGYYVGFEHEVSARGSYNLKPLRRWATENLGVREGLDPKPDSSVRGFEIATQPMTPAFFESVDWDSYMDVLNDAYPISGLEPEGHGIHVHIGRQAFRREKIVKTDQRGRPLKKPRKVMVTDDGMLAAFTLLLTRGHDHLERIGRRVDSHWAVQVPRPVAAAITHQTSEVRSKQRTKLMNEGISVPRGAVNLTNPKTIEIRVFRSTRSAAELRAAVRVVYLAAEYIRFLRTQGSINPSLVNWAQFSLWVADVMPEAYPSISGVEGQVRPKAVTAMNIMAAFETEEAKQRREAGVVNRDMALVGAPSLGEITLDDLLPDFEVRSEINIGDFVQVADPAYATAEEDDEEGYVDDTFYGEVGEVIAQDDHNVCVWRVRLADGRSNVIHEDYLTVTSAPSDWYEEDEDDEF